MDIPLEKLTPVAVQHVQGFILGLDGKLQTM
jgi:hypothetical protein